MSALRLLHTLRFLRPSQILGRARFRLASPRPGAERLPVLALPPEGWVPPARREPCLLGPERARFLSVENSFGARSDWNDPRRDKLWLYNLHYFDDLNALDCHERAGWQRGLIARWIGENPPFAGTGWEPYPTSLRIVNWLKWALAGNALEPNWGASLALQARWLSRRIEWHLLGNHLFVNAKALVFAGACFGGREADAWLARGLAILARELPEQVLQDGGHFERSPLYHSLILEDLLDLANLAASMLRESAAAAAAPARMLRQVSAVALAQAAERWREAAQRMRRWLAVLCHPDGEIALLNDAAFGIAPTPTEIEGYARRLGLDPVAAPGEGIVHLADTGYLRLARGPAVALLDCAPIGPDYLPGHAHADTLTFELSLWGRRVVVDSGTDRYGVSPERLRQRGTAAHNTLEIDGADSSEVWSGFRVARRAYPFGLKVDDSPDGLRAACAHDGYRRLPGRPVHRREWTLTADGLEIRDWVDGKHRSAVARLHLHPAVRTEIAPGGDSGTLRIDGHTVTWQADGCAGARLLRSTWHPRFGVAEPADLLELPLAGPRLAIRLAWG